VTAQIRHMPNVIDAVDPMVMALRDAAAGVLPDDARFRFELCVTEALTNLATHAPAVGREVKIVLTLAPGQAAIKIFDPEGTEPFDLRQHATDLGAVDAMAEGGRGLGLILECADSVTYGPSGTRNALHLVFHASETPDHSAAPLNGAIS